METNYVGARSALEWQCNLMSGGLSAYQVLIARQRVALIVIVATTVGLLLLDPIATVEVIIAVITFSYLGTAAYKIWVASRAVASDDFGLVVSNEVLQSLQRESLPVYTILVPLYREWQVLDQLLAGLRGLDYPAEKLDVKLLLEENDLETIAAVHRATLPSFLEPIVVPSGSPQTKPRACNVGLAAARGEFLVIYDAEDRPDPDQLLKAVAVFQKVGPGIVCLQAKLNYFNPRQNLLTRLFTLEYSSWFDLVLPGLHSLGAPIPLGGTSNHFRVSSLRTLGAWDAFNVAEDCDLGVRIYSAGYRTGVIDSTTWEEANSQVGNWVRQRSRWVKGYLQTYLVHMRNPVALLRHTGVGGFLAFQFLIGGTPFSLLLNPLFWLLTIGYFLTRWQVLEQIFPWPVYYAGLVNLMVANFLFFYLNLFGAYERGDDDLVRAGLLSPLYWALMSIAAWKGTIQLITKPHFWEKTVHGFVLDHTLVAPSSEVNVARGSVAVPSSGGTSTQEPAL